jgi:uncharacterized protein (TIGR02594 family)
MKSYLTVTLIGLFVFLSTANTTQARPRYESTYGQSSIVDEQSERPRVVKKKKYKKKNVKTKKVNASLGTGPAIDKAQTYIGMNARQLGLPLRLWCADFMNMLFGGKDRRAISYASRGTPAAYGCTNCVAVTRRKGGHHVGIVKGYDGKGNPILISGNYSRRVGVGTYSKSVVIAYRYIG